MTSRAPPKFLKQCNFRNFLHRTLEEYQEESYLVQKRHYSFITYINLVGFYEL